MFDFRLEEDLLSKIPSQYRGGNIENLILALNENILRHVRNFDTFMESLFKIDSEGKIILNSTNASFWAGILGINVYENENYTDTILRVTDKVQTLLAGSDISNLISLIQAITSVVVLSYLEYDKIPLFFKIIVTEPNDTLSQISKLLYLLKNLKLPAVGYKVEQISYNRKDSIFILDSSNKALDGDGYLLNTFYDISWGN